VVEPLAEGFQRLDRHREEREAWQQTLEAVKRFTAVYGGYVAILARKRALGLTRAESAHHKARAEHRHYQEEAQAAEAMAGQLSGRQQQLEAELGTLAEQREALRESDEYRSVQELDRLEREARGAAQQHRRAADRWEQGRQSLGRRRRQVAEQVDVVQDRQRAMEAHRRSCMESALAADLEGGHGAIERQVLAEQIEEARGTLRSIQTEREAAVEVLRHEAERVRRALQELARARDRVSDREAALRDTEEALAGAEQDALAAREAFSRQVEGWLDGLEALTMDAQQREALMLLLPYGVRPEVGRLADHQRQHLTEELSDLGVKLQALQVQLREVREEQAALLEAAHRPPPAPYWRGDRPASRPGAPLYMLCDFASDSPDLQAGIEAALEGAGLLDAWVTPKGELLHPESFDVLLRPEPQPGRTLDGVLVPDTAADVPVEVIGRVLRSVGLRGSDDAGAEVSCWVSADGSWRVGPLHGRFVKQAPSYIGVTARERARRQRLAELERTLDDLAGQERQLCQSRDRARKLQELLTTELQSFPDHGPLREAEAMVDAAQRQLGEQRRRLEEAQVAAKRSHSALGQRLERRDLKATQLNLGQWVEKVELLHRLSQEWGTQTLELLHLGSELRQGRRQLADREGEAEEADKSAAEAEKEAHALALAAERAEAKAATTREVVGETRQVVLDRLRRVDDRREAADAELRTVNEALGDARQSLGAAETMVRTAAVERERTDEQRRAADDLFKRLATAGLLTFVDVDLLEDPLSWSYTETLKLARQTDDKTHHLECDQQALDRAENRVTEHHQQLMRSVRQEVHVIQQREDGIPEYRALWAGQRFDLMRLTEELRQEVATSERLLGDQERQLFESFLSGEAHEHLRARLRQAQKLVVRMNEQLRRRPTASGMQIRLEWHVTDEAPAGSRQAIDLLLRTPALLSDSDQTSLQEFLRRRLDEARSSDGLGSMMERMAAVLDYRGWHSFVVSFRSNGTGKWRKLTRRAHAAGSGGQKAVVLHLPLFAAAAAFYESADSTAPRIIVLDEAFAGIDRATRGELMGLLAEFDLDFVMTSYEEWGFYEQLDGLSTYHLSRMSGLRGVHTDWFIWDGQQAQEVGQG